MLASTELRGLDLQELCLYPDPYRINPALAPVVDRPRLELIGEPVIQDLFQRTMVTLPEVQALATSIRTHGFLPTKPFIVVPYDGFRHLVLDGNRRLSAVRMIKSDGSLPPQMAWQLDRMAVLRLDGEGYVIDKPGALKKYLRQAAPFIAANHTWPVPVDNDRLKERLAAHGLKEWGPTLAV